MHNENRRVKKVHVSDLKKKRESKKWNRDINVVSFYHEMGETRLVQLGSSQQVDAHRAPMWLH